MPHQCTGCGHTFADGSKEMLSGCPECGGNKFQFRPEGASFPEDPAESPESPEGDSPPAEGQATPPDAEPPDPEGPSSSVAETVGRATTKVRDFVSSDPGEIESPDPNASWPSEREEATADDVANDVGNDDVANDVGKGDASTRADPSTSSGTDAQPATESGTATNTDADIIDADARREAVEAAEDDAQVSARSDVVSDEELDVAEPSVADRDGADPLAANGSVPPGSSDGVPPGSSDGEVVSEPSDDDPDIGELREQLNDQFESIKIVEPGQYELNLMELYDREEYIIALQENGRYVIQVPEQWIGEEPGER